MESIRVERLNQLEEKAAMDEQQVEALTQPLDGLEREVDPYRQEQRGWKTIACALVAILLCGPLTHVHGGRLS